jgi:hypothetical protein
VGPGPEQYLHTLTNSSSHGDEPVKGPAMVLMPGYGAGTGFFFRWVGKPLIPTEFSVCIGLAIVLMPGYGAGLLFLQLRQRLTLVCMCILYVLRCC